MRKALYILGILDDSDVTWLGKVGQPQSMPAGTTLIKQGVPVDSVFIVLDGQLLVQSGSVNIARLSAGEIVGEISFVDSRPPSASVTTTVDSRVVSIPKATLHAKLESDKGFASRFFLALATFLADRLRVADARLGGGEKDLDDESQNDLDELNSDMLENIALASTRFDMLVKRLGADSSENL